MGMFTTDYNQKYSQFSEDITSVSITVSKILVVVCLDLRAQKIASFL